MGAEAEALRAPHFGRRPGGRKTYRTGVTHLSLSPTRIYLPETSRLASGIRRGRGAAQRVSRRAPAVKDHSVTSGYVLDSGGPPGHASHSSPPPPPGFELERQAVTFRRSVPATSEGLSRHHPPLGRTRGARCAHWMSVQSLARRPV